MGINVINQDNAIIQEKSNPSQTKTIFEYIPSTLYVIAAILLLASIAFPYWGLVLQAPQYPGGLELRVFVNNMTGDADPVLDEVAEIDGLNHYIGMKSLYDAAKFERSIAIPAVITMAILLLVVAFWEYRTWIMIISAIGIPRVFLLDELAEILDFDISFMGNLVEVSRLMDARAIIIMDILLVVTALVVIVLWKQRFAWLLTIPAIGFPFIFLGDLAFWMNNYGQNLDPYAPLSSAIGPFTPPVIGEGVIGQFVTVANVQTGWYIVLTAVILIVVGLLLQKREYLAQLLLRGREYLAQRSS